MIARGAAGRPASNARRLVVEQARKVSMPRDTLDWPSKKARA
jgi:transcriptional/translational regulatory protein YebC/TACO1